MQKRATIHQKLKISEFQQLMSKNTPGTYVYFMELDNKKNYGQKNLKNDPNHYFSGVETIEKLIKLGNYHYLMCVRSLKTIHPVFWVTRLHTIFKAGGVIFFSKVSFGYGGYTKCWFQVRGFKAPFVPRVLNSYVIFKGILVIDVWGIICRIALIWMLLGFPDDQSTLVQVMAWCRLATRHYLNQCWPRLLSPYVVSRPRWVKLDRGLHQTRNAWMTHAPDTGLRTEQGAVGRLGSRQFNSSRHITQ